MQIIVKSIQLVCLSFLTCDSLFLQNVKEDKTMYEISACCAFCLEQNLNMTLDSCYNICDRRDVSNDDLKKLKQIYENHYIKLLCRDDTTLAFQIIWKEFGLFIAGAPAATDENNADPNYNNDINYSSSSTSSTSIIANNNITTTEPLKKSENEIYFIKIYKAENATEQQRLLSNSSYIKVENLEPNTAYKITAIVVHSNREYSLIVQNQQFTTLHRKYTPKQVPHIELQSYIEDEHDKKSLKAIILWKPALDMTCHYDIVFYPTETTSFIGDVKSVEVRDLEHLYNSTVEPLILGTHYTIGIRSKNTKEDSKESILKYLNIKTPSCLERHNNNLTICPPLEPNELEAMEEVLALNEYSINITWEKPTLEPDYYIVRILDLDLRPEFEPNNLTVNVTKDQNSLFIPHIILNGHVYEVYVTAYSKGGNATAYITKPLKNLQISVDQHYILRYVIAIILPLTMFALISMVTFVICHRRAKIKRYKERCKYFEDLEKKAPMDPNSNFEIVGRNMSLEHLQLELEDKLFFNDEMEIKLIDVELFEVIGEGAFGFVRRGKLKIDEKKEADVAVKMLKDQPSIEEIKTFRREIEVMKSVGKHPHIVNIVGHYTKNLKEMMLLTEYCSLGNLLDLLRAEWQRINKIVYIQKTTLTPSNSPPAVPYHNKYSIINNNNNNTIFNYRDKIVVSTGVTSSKIASRKSTTLKPENIFNFEKTFIDKTTLKYKNIGEDNKLRVYKKRSRCSITNNNNNNNNKIKDHHHHHHHHHNHYRHIKNLRYNYKINQIADKCKKSQIETTNNNDETSTTTTITDENHENDNIEFNNHILKQKSDNNNDCINTNTINTINNNNGENSPDNENIKLVINKGYGLQSGFCTNFCKCQVDIIDTLTLPPTVSETSLNTNNDNHHNDLNEIIEPQFAITTVNHEQQQQQQHQPQSISKSNNIINKLPLCLNLPEKQIISIDSIDNSNCLTVHNDSSQLLDSNGSDDIIIPEMTTSTTTATTLLTKNNFKNINYTNNNNNNSNNNKIQIKNCDCKLKLKNHNIKNLINNNLINDDTEKLAVTTTITASTATTPVVESVAAPSTDLSTTTTLLIENQGYYKFLKTNSQDTKSNITINCDSTLINDKEYFINNYHTNSNEEHLKKDHRHDDDDNDDDEDDDDADDDDDEDDDDEDDDENDNNNENDKNDENDDEDDDILLKGFNNYDLIIIAKQIALGMEYLSKCKVVHRDLAARNVLLFKDRTAKIADFGLSRDVYQENVYKKTGNGKLPIKWLALESMTHQVYTTQSDVWSYGILLYEIATLGGTPYPSISTNRLLHLLKNGYRMEKPKNCGQALYDLMSSCWKTIPSQRPTFTEIIQNLDDILEKLSDDVQIENLIEDSSNDKRSKSVSDESYLNPLL